MSQTELCAYVASGIRMTSESLRSMFVFELEDRHTDKRIYVGVSLES
jgi:hypothetical protein